MDSLAIVRYAHKYPPHLDITKIARVSPKPGLVIEFGTADISSLKLLCNGGGMSLKEGVEGLVLEENGGLEDVHVGADAGSDGL